MTKKKPRDQWERQGRPPIYEQTPEALALMEQRIADYFEYIKGEKDESAVTVMGSQNWLRAPEPPTVTGLTLHLDFSSKDTLYNYAKIPYFSDPIKKALSRIEQFHEIRTSGGMNCTGNIFILKNFGWKDKTEQEINMKQAIHWHEERTYEADEETDQGA